MAAQVKRDEMMRGGQNDGEDKDEGAEDGGGEEKEGMSVSMSTW